MNRTVLFRGVSVRDGRWVHGFYVEIQGKPYIAGEKSNTEVFPDSAGECTGMADKNGKIIFEGDLVSGEIYNFTTCRDTYIENEPVLFKAGSFCIAPQATPLPHIAEIEVVGTIWEKEWEPKKNIE